MIISQQMNLDFMKKSVIKLISLIFLLLISKNSFAAISPIVGFSETRIVNNDPNFSFVNKNEIAPAFSYGLSANFNKLIVTIQTNRMIEITSDRAVIHNNLTFENRTKITNDNLTFGYKFNRLIPGFTLANAKVNQSLYYQNKFVDKKINHAILTGFNLGIILNKNNIVNLFLINSNRELNLSKAYGISLNYIF